MKTHATRKPRSPELAAYEALAKRIRHGDDSEETATACSEAEAAYRASRASIEHTPFGGKPLPHLGLGDAQ